MQQAQRIAGRALAGSLVDLLRNLVDAAARRRRRRHDYARLMLLDDYLLDDIGINRHQLPQQPSWQWQGREWR